MTQAAYKEKIKKLSERIIEAQKPIRILDAIKWDNRVEDHIKKSKFKSFPHLSPGDYAKIKLGYNTRHKKDELIEIGRLINKTLGARDPVGQLLCSITEQYVDVISMLEARGTKKFWEYSKKLYGSPKDHFFDRKKTILDLGKLLNKILGGIHDCTPGPTHTDDISAGKAVSMLNKRFKSYFHGLPVKALIDDGIVADAAAGSNKVKIKRGATFSKRDIDILEVHEGWVHLGTTQNGRSQHIAKWLSKGPPRCTSTQEGLAVIMEIFSFHTYPKRAQIINNRILGINMAEDGANILEVIRFFRDHGYDDNECLTMAKRVFRGGPLEGGAPFTKDIVYCRGFVENYNFMRAAIRLGKPHLIPFLFVGKVSVQDIPLLYRLHQEGIVDAPKILPPQFRDLNGLAVWMAFSSFLNQIDMHAIQDHYNNLFKKHL